LKEESEFQLQRVVAVTSIPWIIVRVSLSVSTGKFMLVCGSYSAAGLGKASVVSIGGCAM